MKKRLIGLVMSVVMLFGVVGLVGCGVNVLAPPTMEENIQNLSEIVQREFIVSGKFESFEIHPVFIGNQQQSIWGFILIEFAPIGFMYVQISIGEHLAYTTCGGLFGSTWKQYPLFRSTDVTHNRTSYFYGIENENRYFFVIYDDRSFPGIREVVPAVRRGENFLNLVSNQVFCETALENQESITLNISSINLNANPQ